MGHGGQGLGIFMKLPVGNKAQVAAKPGYVIVECRVSAQRGDDDITWRNEETDQQAHQPINAFTDGYFFVRNPDMFGQRSAKRMVLRVGIGPYVRRGIAKGGNYARAGAKARFIGADAGPSGYSGLTFYRFGADKGDGFRQCLDDGREWGQGHDGVLGDDFTPILARPAALSSVHRVGGVKRPRFW